MPPAIVFLGWPRSEDFAQSARELHDDGMAAVDVLDAERDAVGMLLVGGGVVGIAVEFDLRARAGVDVALNQGGGLVTLVCLERGFGESRGHDAVGVGRRGAGDGLERAGGCDRRSGDEQSGNRSEHVRADVHDEVLLCLVSSLPL